MIYGIEIFELSRVTDVGIIHEFFTWNQKVWCNGQSGIIFSCGF